MSKAKGIMVGNYHEVNEFSHPRLGISAVKIDGKCFAAITAYGIQMVDEGNLDFKPLVLTKEWLEKFNFDYGFHETGIYGWYIGDFIIKSDYGAGFLYHGNNREVKFVHDLQNLFAASEETELKLK